MLSTTTWRRRQVQRECADSAGSHDRYVDMGIELRVVERDADRVTALEAGGIPTPEELRNPNGVPLRVLRVHRLGGIVDTKARPRRIFAPSKRPVVWYCSVPQEPLLLHDESIHDRIHVWGAEGAGKTAVLAPWLILRALSFTGLSVMVLATAPNEARLGMVEDALAERMPESWYHWSERDKRFELANGVRIQLLGTHRHSKQLGEKTQGYNAAAAGSDEIQDTSAEAEGGIEMRGRSAPLGRYKRLCTASVKDSPQARNRRDAKKKSGMWTFRKLVGPDNPFTWPRFWEEKKATLDPRRYQRSVLAEDPGPEFVIYYNFDRQRHLRPKPEVGARDVTAQILRKFGAGNFEILVGHDPGATCDVSVLLKAYLLPGERSATWWVVDELTTERTTAEGHAKRLEAKLRRDWGIQYTAPEQPKALVFGDPHSEFESKGRPHKSVYRVFRRCGFTFKSASPLKHVVPKEAGIEMVLGLLGSESGRTRLYVDVDDRGQPVAKNLVKAFESAERDAAGEAETEKKGANDLSHWPAALRYGLWRIEKPKDYDEEAA